jgi:RNA polymerase sigma-70 factor (ECF subfamily)
VAARPAYGDDAALIRDLLSGDEAAFAFLVRSRGPRLLAVARRLLGNEQDAQDALQDAFLAAFKSLGSFQGGALLSTWLHRIVVNAALMKLRTRRRKAEEPIDTLLPDFLEDGHHVSRPLKWCDPADLGLEREETRRLVRGSIERLPEDYRIVLVLRDIEELDTMETARLLGIEAGAVKTRLHRARQALRALLAPQLSGGAS